MAQTQEIAEQILVSPLDYSYPLEIDWENAAVGRKRVLLFQTQECLTALASRTIPSQPIEPQQQVSRELGTHARVHQP